MVVVKCPLNGCDYSTEDLSESLVVELVKLHMLSHTSQPAVRGPKLNRPTIEVGADEEAWTAFQRRWETFRRGSQIQESEASTQLFECAGPELSELALKLEQDLTTKPVDEVMQTLHSLAVIPIARGIVRAELMRMEQSNDETFRTFAARVKGKAETCGLKFTMKCSRDQLLMADYTMETMRDVLLAGIADIDIRREALSCEDLQHRPLNELIAFVERREMPRNAAAEHSVSALSSFKRSKAVHRKATPPPVDHQRSVRPCPVCNNPYQIYRKGKRGGWNKTPFQKCYDCYRNGQTSQQCASLESALITSKNSYQSRKVGSFVLSHVIFKNECWRKARVSSHLTHLRIHHLENGVSANVTAIADTGAQSNLWGYNEFIDKGFSRNDLQPVTLRISAANNQSLNIVGAFCAKLEGKSPKGDHVICEAVIYVSDSVLSLYLSCDAMRDLAIINDSFPTVGNYYTSEDNNMSSSDNAFIRVLNSGCASTSNVSLSSLDCNSTSQCVRECFNVVPCTCPQRECVPPRPKHLPFPALPENNNKMREWLLNKFAGSTFNTCPHRPLQQMAGPPLEIHLRDNAKPRVCHTPSSIPLHWQKKVHEDLVRDEALRVIERVPYGVTLTWCHRMVVTRKHDGSPRRTVDLSPLNKFCSRETYSAESPFRLARRIPHDTWKTVTDAWNGYHSVPLRGSDRHLTTFITPYGRYRYLRAPQGFLSSGDGYNRRFEAVLSDFPRKERCVDDTIHYDDQLEAHWWRTIDLLILVGSSGIVLNPDKFQFAQKVVEFAGFRISENHIEPLPKYIDAIAGFPTPTNNTDIRSWYGLINQVSNYSQLRDNLAPFRKFLSSKTKFYWSEELDRAFEKSKLDIIASIKTGVQIFDMDKPTCLRTDWSTRGIGYFLLQKHCHCKEIMPDCCPTGWRITLAGSRFLQKAERNYAAIKGEALAVAWSLEQTRYFTQGCPKLLVVTDHKPLLKIFGDRTLDEISNTRVFRLKQRTLPWHFKIAYLPGKTNHAADATSRHPSPYGEPSDGDKEELLINAAIISGTEEISSVSWSLIAKETVADPVLSKLKRAIDENFEIETKGIQPYLKFKDALYIQDGVIMINDRAVIPPKLRQSVLSTLHAAHQGVAGMASRARAIVFWPMMMSDIERMRANCKECKVLCK